MIRDILIKNTEKCEWIIYVILIIPIIFIVLTTPTIENNKITKCNYDNYNFSECELKYSNYNSIDNKIISIIMNKSINKSINNLHSKSVNYRSENSYGDRYGYYLSLKDIIKYLWDNHRPSRDIVIIWLIIFSFVGICIAKIEFDDFMDRRAILIKYLGIKGLGDINKITF